MMDLKKLPNQKSNEQVVLFIRRFWFELLKIFSSAFLLFGVPIIILFFFLPEAIVLIEKPIIGPIIVLFSTGYFLSIWLFLFFEYTDYYLDTWVVTNERILNIEQHGLFKRIASELHLATIQDITAEVNGLIHTFFDYGDVYIQTAATKTRFVFRDIAHPEQVKNQIIKLSEADKARHGMVKETEHTHQSTETIKEIEL